MPCVGVLFELRKAATVPGQGIRCAGGRPELGDWLKCGPEGPAPQLFTSALVYPRWFARVPVWVELPSNQDRVVLEYKFVRDQQPAEAGGGDAGRVRWEDIPNRRVELPSQHGSVWIISDAQWNSAAEPARVSRATPAELRSRRWGLDPESMAHGMLPSATERAKCLLTPRTPREGFPAAFALSNLGHSIEEFYLTPRLGFDLTNRSTGIEDIYDALSFSRVLCMLGPHVEKGTADAAETTATLQASAPRRPRVPASPRTPVRATLPYLNLQRLGDKRACCRAQPWGQAPQEEEEDESDSHDDGFSDADTCSPDGSPTPDEALGGSDGPEEEEAAEAPRCMGPEAAPGRSAGEWGEEEQEERLTQEIQRLFLLLRTESQERTVNNLARFACIADGSFGRLVV